MMEIGSEEPNQGKYCLLIQSQLCNPIKTYFMEAYMKNRVSILVAVGRRAATGAEKSG